jgi:ribosomal subunit interface protein
MLIQVNYGDVKKTDVIDDYVNDRVTKELAHFAHRITRVEVHLHDENGASKHGAADKRCTMEARPAGHQPMAVEHSGDNFQKVIAEAAGKLARMLKKTFDKAK